MPLADASAEFGPSRGSQPWASKVDDILDAMPDEDAETFKAWLHDPDWSANAISKALHRYSVTEGVDMTCGHPTIDRWRMHHGIKVKRRAAG